MGEIERHESCSIEGFDVVECILYYAVWSNAFAYGAFCMPIFHAFRLIILILHSSWKLHKDGIFKSQFISGLARSLGERMQNTEYHYCMRSMQLDSWVHYNFDFYGFFLFSMKH